MSKYLDYTRPKHALKYYVKEENKNHVQNRNVSLRIMVNEIGVYQT